MSKNRSSKQLKTVLIFAHECAPYHYPGSTMGAQRPAQFAKHLPTFDWQVIVICCNASQRRTVKPETLNEISAQVRKRLFSAECEKSIIISTPSLTSDGFLDWAWCKTVREDQNWVWSRVLIRKFFTMLKFLRGDYSQSWQPCARMAAEAVAQEIKIDACIGEHSPDAGLFLGRWFSKRFGVPWIADFRDPILQPLHPSARTIYKPIARHIVKTAKATINVNRLWAELDKRYLGRASYCIPNGFDPQDFPTQQTTRRGEHFSIVYYGNIWPIQRLDIFFQGLFIAKEKEGRRLTQNLKFKYRGLAHYKVMDLARQYEVQDLTDSGPMIPRNEVLAMAGTADLLLLLSVARLQFDGEYFSKGFHPGKVFEYFGLSRPIMCVPGDHGLLDELIQETRTGVILRTPQEIAGYLLESLRYWKQGHSLPYQPKKEPVSLYTRQAQSGQLAKILNSILNDANEKL
jgi:hypothetical protein